MIVGKECSASNIKYYRANYKKIGLNKHYHRIVFSSKSLPLKTGDKKYAEIITFDDKSTLPYAIAIGANPAHAETDIFDKTNFNIAAELENMKKYKGYYLLNLYPQLSNSVKDLNAILNKTVASLEMQYIICLFLKETENDVYLFWGDKISGKNAKFKKLLSNELEQYITDRVLTGSSRFFYSANINNEMIHPCKNNFHFEPLTKNNLSEI